MAEIIDETKSSPIDIIVDLETSYSSVTVVAPNADAKSGQAADAKATYKALETKASKADIPSIDLSDYAKKADVDSSLSGKADKSELSRYAKTSYVDDELIKKQDKLTAGSNITILNGVISAVSEGGSSVELSKPSADGAGKAADARETYLALEGKIDKAEGTDVILGESATSNPSDKSNVVLGAQSSVTSGKGKGVAVGYGANIASGENVVAVGANVTADDNTPIVIGSRSDSSIKVSREGVLTVGGKIVAVKNDVDTALSTKANVSNVDASINSINTTLNTKANASDLESISKTINTKADTSTLEELRSTTDGALALKQDKLVPGTNIEINGNVINAKIPTTEGGASVTLSPPSEDGTGKAADAKATFDELQKKFDIPVDENVSLGKEVKATSAARSVTIGSYASTELSQGSIAIGYRATTGSYPNLIAIGSSIEATDDNPIVIGSRSDSKVIVSKNGEMTVGGKTVAMKSDVDTALNAKANASDIEAINKRLEEIVNIPDLEAINAALEGKADVSDIEAINTALESKVNNSALITINEAINNRASVTVVENLSKEVEARATKEDVTKALELKQNKLSPGTNIEINGDVINAIIPTIEGGSSITLSPPSEDGAGKAADAKATYDELTTIRSDLDKKQNKLTAGVNITISDKGVISATGTASGGTSQVLFEVTYEQLKALRDANGLTPGALYRITDYVTTVREPFSKTTDIIDPETGEEQVIVESIDVYGSTQHPFDIIVTATGTNTLSEEARAAEHVFTDGDIAVWGESESTYFSECDLGAWKLWYCLDNDYDRFDWADDFSGQGKGVIYRMIDEHNNDVPYDFKSIKSYTGGYNDYNFLSYVFNDSGGADASVVGSDVFNNKILPAYDSQVIFDEDFGDYRRSGTLVQVLNFNHFIGSVSDNTFSENCRNNYIKDGKGNFFGSNCHGNGLSTDCNFNTFGSDCAQNVLGTGCTSNTFGNSCYENNLDYNVLRCSIGSGSSGNTIPFKCRALTLQNDVRDMILRLPEDDDTYYRNVEFKSGLRSVTIEDTREDNTYGYKVFKPKGSVEVSV